MIVVGNLKQVSAVTLVRILREPSLVTDVMKGEVEDDVEALDLGESWNAIHYLLTGTVGEGEPPLANAVLGNKETGEQDMYGPVRYLTVEEVRDVALALAEVTEEDFLQRFNPGEMRREGVYPYMDGGRGNLFAPKLMTDKQYLLIHFNKLVEYYGEAADKGNGMLFWFE